MPERPGPLVVSVTDLLRRPGTRRHVDLLAVLDDLAVTGSGVPPGGDVQVDLVLEAVAGSVVVTGGVEAPWEGPCRRCLRTTHGRVRAEVREVFAPASLEGDTYPLEGDQVDLEPLVRDVVLLALPLAPLCDPDCQGPDPDDFPVTTGEDPPIDPRWAGLDALRFDR